MFIKKLMLCVLSIIVIPGCLIQAALAQGSNSALLERQKTLVLCRVSDNPKKHIKKLQPIVDYVAGKLNEFGITKGEVIFAKDNRQLINFLKQGKVDWVTETSFSATLYEEKAAAEIILLRWKKGVSKYKTAFIARKDSGITDINNLVGKKIAFEDQGSTSGFYMPASMILKEGLELSELATPQEQAPANMIGYVFTRAEINITTLVHRGLVDAGAISNLDWQETDRVPEKMKQDLDIFQRSQDIPRALELVRRDLDPDLKIALINILANAHEDPAAKEALKKYKKTTRFDEIDASIQQNLENIRELRAYISEELY